MRGSVVKILLIFVLASSQATPMMASFFIGFSPFGKLKVELNRLILGACLEHAGTHIKSFAMPKESMIA
jgi:fumarate reductase subunit C